MEFTATDQRTSLGPIYRSPEGYRLYHDRGRVGWYVRDHTGFILGRFTTKREAVAEAAIWYDKFGGRC